MVLDFAEQIYNDIIQPADRDVDFEVSIDEVATPTTPQDHFFVANELIKRGVKVNSVAPRFCGEFQKALIILEILISLKQSLKCMLKSPIILAIK